MKKFECKHKRFVIQAKRPTDKEWSEWTRVDDYDEAAKHAKRAEELGYCSRIIDNEQAMNQETCVSCGAVIPEGRQVCLNCERGKDNGLEQIH